jgi:hypothetical protein
METNEHSQEAEELMRERVTCAGAVENERLGRRNIEWLEGLAPRD